LGKQRMTTVLVGPLARIAHAISDLVGTGLEQDTTHIALREAYRECCKVSSSGMTVADFADMTAQLLVCSCFVARYYHNGPEAFGRRHLTHLLSYAHPLHRLCVA
jgi:hypothetical protein